MSQDERSENKTPLAPLLITLHAQAAIIGITLGLLIDKKVIERHELNQRIEDFVTTAPEYAQELLAIVQSALEPNRH